MQIICCCGKGGVGKTFSAVSLGRYYAGQGEKVGIIDYDGGHSVRRELGDPDGTLPNAFQYAGGNLFTAVVEETLFIGIADFEKGRTKDYLVQFPGHQGIVPFADMIMTFFGAPTDPSGLQKFVRLVELVTYARKNQFARLIIDVEPTAGFQTMIRNAQSLTRSIVNLSQANKVKLATLGVKWPDIKAFLTSPYMKDAAHYAAEIRAAVGVLGQANFLLVCIPKRSPVMQVAEVQKIIRGFNGRIVGCVINNVTSADYEQENIALLDPRLRKVRIAQFKDLEKADQKRRTQILCEVGSTIAQKFLL